LGFRIRWKGWGWKGGDTLAAVWLLAEMASHWNHQGPWSKLEGGSERQLKLHRNTITTVWGEVQNKTA
jgi:hypothetical protein